MAVGMKLFGFGVLLCTAVHNATGSDYWRRAANRECMALLESEVSRTGGTQAWINHYRQSMPSQQRACVDDLARSLSPAPTYNDILPYLTKDRLGNYQLGKQPPPEISEPMYINELAARGLRDLTVENLVDDPKVIPPLIECADHPEPSIATNCGLALSNLTRRAYSGADVTRWTPHRPFVDEWRAWWEVLKHGHPVFDEFLANECRASIRNMLVRVARAQRLGNDSIPYLSDESPPTRAGVNNPRLDLDSGWSGTLFEFDIGAHNTDWWPAKKTSRIALVIRRAGNPNLDSQVSSSSSKGGY